MPRQGGFAMGTGPGAVHLNSSAKTADSSELNDIQESEKERKKRIRSRLIWGTLLGGLGAAAMVEANRHKNDLGGYGSGYAYLGAPLLLAGMLFFSLALLDMKTDE